MPTGKVISWRGGHKTKRFSDVKAAASDAAAAAAGSRRGVADDAKALVLVRARNRRPRERIEARKVEAQHVTRLEPDELVLHQYYLLEAKLGRSVEGLSDERVGIDVTAAAAAAAAGVGGRSGARRQGMRRHPVRSPDLEVDAVLDRDDLGEGVPALDDAVGERRLRRVGDDDGVGELVLVRPQLRLVSPHPRI